LTLACLGSKKPGMINASQGLRKTAVAVARGVAVEPGELRVR
jgi:hypothetical protein